MSSSSCSYGADGTFACGGKRPAFPSDGPYAPPGPPGAFKCAGGGGPPPESAWTKAKGASGGGQPEQQEAARGPAPAPWSGSFGGGAAPLSEFGAPIA